MAEPSVVDTLIEDGIAAFEQNRFREARQSLSQAVLREPADVRARFWLGAAQYHMGNLGEARKHLEQAFAAEARPIAERPAAAHEYLCRSLATEDIDRALTIGVQGVELAPDDPRMRLAVGDLYLRLERDDEALAAYDEAWRIELDRSAAADPRRPGRVPFARSTVLVRQKRWQEALEAIDAALERDGRHAGYHNRRGVILADGLDDAEAAVAAARRATELDPATVSSGGDGVYWFNLASYLRALERFDGALEAIDRAIAVSPRRQYRALQQELLRVAQRNSRPEPVTSQKLDFSRVGGMNSLKDQVRRIVELVHTRRDAAQRYGISRNGILLYGPPGCGKTFFAEAMAGEFGLTYFRVELGAVVTKYVGGAPERIEAIFAEARTKLPCLLFFDEFDAVAGRRDDSPMPHDQQLVNALLQQVEAARDVPGLIVVAATNRLERLDPAAIREGRFDYKVKIYRPDFDARKAILEVLLERRPHDGEADITTLAHAMEGFSAAQVRSVVDAAAMAAMESESPISDGHLREALQERVRARRYAGPPMEWDELILPTETKRKLQFVERFIENPELVRELGVDPPTGLLLHGPPGTGKTTIARVLASQTDASFFAINAADVFSKWLGESEQRVQETFEQARDNVPAILFIDEIDAILGSRSEDGSGGTRAANAVVNTFLAEMDGIAGSHRVFVVGATNRPELVDDAVLRPGRLSEVLEIGLPGVEGRLALLQLFSTRMKLDGHVDLAAVAAKTDGASGADLRGLCTAAGRNALLREFAAASERPAVTAEDFAAAVDELFPENRWSGEKRLGFLSGRR